MEELRPALEGLHTPNCWHAAGNVYTRLELTASSSFTLTDIKEPQRVLHKLKFKKLGWSIFLKLISAHLGGIRLAEHGKYLHLSSCRCYKQHTCLNSLLGDKVGLAGLHSPDFFPPFTP